MDSVQIVIDTNVFISALKSNRGAAYYLLSLIGKTHFEVNISVPLVLEYEAIAKRVIPGLDLTEKDIDDIIDYICLVSNKHEIYYLWRPFLKDPKDDLVLELAVQAGCHHIISFNKRDFFGAEKFGISVYAPWEFLKERGLL